MTKSKTKKPVDYVSKDMLKRELDDFSERRLPEIEKIVGEKYGSIFSPRLVREASITACAKLEFALSLQCVTFKDSPSYRHQLTMLYDFRQLLKNERKPKYFISRRKSYYRQYENICTLLDEYNNYQKTGVVNPKFLRLIEVGQENFPTEHAEEYLAYTKEMTLVMIAEVTNMVRDQIYRVFPSQGPKFVQDILKENPYDGSIAHIEAENTEEAAITDARKVTFA
ncbi:MAG: hypothetical protein NXI01_08025 [Gammaproteobacteria bacterium]|nr:hypothetical protein [Gammaproteobacteria bacterium]